MRIRRCSYTGRVTHLFGCRGGPGKGAGRPVHDAEFTVLAALLVGQRGGGGGGHGAGVDEAEVACGVVTLFGLIGRALT